MSKKGKAAGGAGVGVIVLVLLALLGGGFGFGFGTGGNGSGDGDNSDVIEENQDKQNSEKEDDEKENTTVLKVTVSGSDYYYDNEKISFDNLIKEIESEEGDIIVEITDEDAGRNAYQKLIDKLDDLYIDYRER